jgi:hypothetical protein
LPGSRAQSASIAFLCRGLAGDPPARLAAIPRANSLFENCRGISCFFAAIAFQCRNISIKNDSLLLINFYQVIWCPLQWRGFWQFSLVFPGQGQRQGIVKVISHILSFY